MKYSEGRMFKRRNSPLIAESRVRHYPTLSKEEKKRNSFSIISVASGSVCCLTIT
jgi:hypothetical protein